MQKITKAIIPAAGFGTRFLPATKSQPKEMLPVVDKPTIQYIVEEATYESDALCGYECVCGYTFEKVLEGSKLVHESKFP